MMFPRLVQRMRNLVRTIKNASIDLRFGKFVGGYRRNPCPGATGTGATDYALMPQIFSERVRTDDVIVDVGCGRGRVINWFLYKGYQNRIYGIELMEDIAAETRHRLRKYSNVTIITGNAITHLPEEGTLFYLANPFDCIELLKEFAEKLHQQYGGNKRLLVLYFAPVHIDAFKKSEYWNVEEVLLTLPKAGRFEERHHHLAVIQPRPLSLESTELNDETRGIPANR